MAWRNIGDIVSSRRDRDVAPDSRLGRTRPARPRRRPITGQRATLRATTLGDVEILTEWFGDPEIFRYWGKRPMSRETVVAKYTNQRKNVHAFIVPGLRGRGLGTDAVTAMVCFLGTTQGVTRITVDPLLDNPRAVTFWKKCAFRPVREVLHDEGPALLLELAP